MELTKQRLALGLAGAAIGLGFGLHLFLYQPLLNELKVRGSECRLLEREARQARGSLVSLKQTGKEKVLIPEKEVSLAMDELTRQGGLKTVNFISITPKAVEKPPDSRYQVLPIELEIEATYEALGRFLGSLDELKQSLVTVAGLNVTSKKETPAKLKSKLTVHMYLSA